MLTVREKKRGQMRITFVGTTGHKIQIWDV